MSALILGMLISATQASDSLMMCDGQRVTVDVMVIPKEDYRDFVTFGMENILDELADKKGADGIIVIPEYDTATDLEDLPAALHQDHPHTVTGRRQRRHQPPGTASHHDQVILHRAVPSLITLSVTTFM